MTAAVPCIPRRWRPRFAAPAAIGVALDGDADRVILTDERGEIVDGDQIMAILGTRLLARGALPGNTVVATVMSNLGLERALAARDGKLLRASVGDRYVVEAMREKGFIFGGEQSGHIIFLEEATTGDGLLAALQILSVMVQEERPLSELAAIMTRYPQVLINFAVARKTPLPELAAVATVIRRVERCPGARRPRAGALLGHGVQGAGDDRGDRREHDPRLRRGDRRNHAEGTGANDSPPRQCRPRRDSAPAARHHLP
jgi:hypothetical protein